MSLLKLVIVGDFAEQPRAFRSYLQLQAPEVAWHHSDLRLRRSPLLLFVTPGLPACAHSPTNSVVLRNCQLEQLHFRCFVKGWNSSPSLATLFLGPSESCQGKWRWHEHVHFGFVFQGWVKWWTGLYAREREGKRWAAHIGWSRESVGNDPEKKNPSDWKFESLNALEPTASYRISVFSDLLWVSAMAVWATGQIVNQNEQGLSMASVVHRLY